MGPFIIGFVGRVGSSWLEGLIDDHRDAECAGEIFFPGGLFDQSGRPVPDFLSAFAERAPVAGFKLSRTHILERADIGRHLEDAGYKAIILTRENVVDQFISVSLAARNKKWRSDDGAYHEHSFVACPRLAVEFVQQHVEFNDELKAALCRLPSIEATYEGLQRGKDLPRILDFLGLEQVSLTSRFERQRLFKSQAYAIKNYDEVRQALHEHGYGQHCKA